MTDHTFVWAFARALAGYTAAAGVLILLGSMVLVPGVLGALVAGYWGALGGLGFGMIVVLSTLEALDS